MNRDRLQVALVCSGIVVTVVVWVVLAVLAVRVIF